MSLPLRLAFEHYDELQRLTEVIEKIGMFCGEQAYDLFQNAGGRRIPTLNEARRLFELTGQIRDLNSKLYEILHQILEDNPIHIGRPRERWDEIGVDPLDQVIEKLREVIGKE